MYNYNQFILWKPVTRPNGKIDKIPLSPHTLKPADCHDSSNQTDVKTAEQIAATSPELHVGFVFTDNDPFFFLDIDGAYNGTWSPLANDLITRFNGAAIEVSYSGRGIHIFGTGVPPEPRKMRNDTVGVELYTSRRFVALTGTHARGDITTDCTDALAHVVREYLSTDANSDADVDGWTTEPVPDYTHLSDADLLNRAMQARSAASVFGSKASFADLYTANEDALAVAYPSVGGVTAYDASAADAALAQHLAFWTGKDCERIRTLMQSSALVRDKWTDRAEYYLPRTIQGAVARQREVYTGAPKPDPVGVAVDDAAPDGPSVVTGYQYQAISDQLDYFKGCVYVRSAHRIWVPDGALLKPDQFKATYGGFTFARSNDNGQGTTRNAWEAFAESQAIRWPKVGDTAFRPLQPPGVVFTERGSRYVNVYTDRRGPRMAGDITPFVKHLELLLPHEGDREVLLSYMAFCVQNPGLKAQWCTLLQGVPGNGKTLFANVLGYAIGREHCHQLDAGDLDNKFNSWIEGNLMIFVEEIRMGGRYELADRLKILITNEAVPLQSKGVDQRTGQNCANFFLNSNYRDAVIKSVSDRRFSVLYCAQQVAGDLKRDGMDNVYFKKIYEWLRHEGYAYVADHLSKREVTCDMLGRAPVTSSTPAAISESLGTAEQIIMDAVQLEHVGFRSDLISISIAHRLVASHGKKLSPYAMARAMEEVGYIKHPALNTSDGRLRIDGEMHRVYVKPGTETAMLQSSAEVLTAWREANRPKNT